MTAIYNKDAKKKATNISINSELLEKAKKYKINISANVEKTLEELIKQHEIQNWEKENKEAIEDYNQRIAQNGVFSDGLRSF
ncbi:type II toxin-antitoxin system CcdA family antitoxin [Aliarcobacter butzleri]|uniref:type II toxin-antitoxin system CcdA family antitoxin n=1 Tax=Aliarcobacter butzleri TaxID=28197 RepID=UPI00125EBBDC|nr:type II toxin-antitoxin system CcdA family antitoxin [Aliarcobacter butzleri]MCG3705645.1 type II toxin-antitoxin system CcdA family antitoxin [Aliarcobacter butzleri]MCT7554848.1 type II toxin-antitoxin system CcdA family antitoxin [Aliarcobacter butzleri]MCT7579523.1 type II toxin-antitoxin system CcdA family antitoxin [Aliarcobacter butzleri]MDK2090274.1 type II toxin-antitoxin system CcdA family antitoxin [Aliarcobacter butzleri]MDN5102361.1 type II toxin-antitoxin system CcdA family an